MRLAAEYIEGLTLEQNPERFGKRLFAIDQLREAAETIEGLREALTQSLEREARIARAGHDVALALARFMRAERAVSDDIKHG